MTTTNTDAPMTTMNTEAPMTTTVTDAPMTTTVTDAPMMTAKRDPPKRKEVTPAQFKKKVQAVMKQIYELLTLCDVPGCLIIRSPDNSQTYTWPESRDEVKRVLEMYYSALKSKSEKKGAKKVVKKSPGFRSLEMFAKMEGLSVDEKKALLGKVDARIEVLKKKIDIAEKRRAEKSKKVVTCDDSERILVDDDSERMLVDDDSEDWTMEESRKCVRDLERVVLGLKKRIEGETLLGKRKSNGTDDKLEKLSLPKVRKLLHDIESNLESLTRETNQFDDGTFSSLRSGTEDDDTFLTLGCGVNEN